MTPATAAGMARLAGLEVAALTDHNTTRNCPAFFRACEAYGLSPLAGMELTTAEDIHLLCLFESCEAAAAFECAVALRRVHIKNKPAFFGRQLVMNENDELLAEEPDLLPNATTLPLEEAFTLTEQYGGVCYPAHVDREANGLIAVLGDFPVQPFFRQAEFRDPQKIPAYCASYPALRALQPVFGSDAHRPQDIPDASFSLSVDDGRTPAQAVFRLLKGVTG